MGLKPDGLPPSNNELMWWRAMASVRPTGERRIDILEARLMGCFSGTSAEKLLLNWFDKSHDPEFKKQQDADILASLRADKKKREASSVKAN
jgi:hypothetical protein